MTYQRVPNEVDISEVRGKAGSWSAGMYERVVIPNSRTSPVSALLDSYEKGEDPGSIWYIERSTHYFIRTKALQEHSSLLYPKGESIVPINPRAFNGTSLKPWDILMSKDSNVGECGMVDDSPRWANHMYSGGVVLLRPTCDRFYLFSFLKHPIFKAQLLGMVPRGATIAHANSLWLKCLVPWPNQDDGDAVVKYVSALTEAIVRREKAIRERAELIHALIDGELRRQYPGGFVPRQPDIREVRERGRFDAAIYGQEYQSKIDLVKRYPRGARTPSQAGFTVTPGPSLEIKLLGTRLDSDAPKPGYYTLLIPANISEYGTMSSITYLGTAKGLPLLRSGDVLIGEAGFQKGRSIVLIEAPERCTTNAHGLYARRTDGDLDESIFFRCIFNWYRSQGLIDLMAVGGSGGHFSPEYFEFVLIPDFPNDLRATVCRLYHQESPPPERACSVEGLVGWHDEWNSVLGIWQLDRELRALRRELRDVQDAIIAGTTVRIPASLTMGGDEAERERRGA